MLKPVQRELELSTYTEVKQATTGTPSNISGNDLLYVFEKMVGHCKKFIACEGQYNCRSLRNPQG
jgi:hypothetical protein